MTLAEFGAAYAFLLPADKDAFTPFDEEELAVFEEIRRTMDGNDDIRRAAD